MRLTAQLSVLANLAQWGYALCVPEKKGTRLGRLNWKKRTNRAMRFFFVRMPSFVSYGRRWWGRLRACWFYFFHQSANPAIRRSPHLAVGRGLTVKKEAFMPSSARTPVQVPFLRIVNEAAHHCAAKTGNVAGLSTISVDGLAAYEQQETVRVAARTGQSGLNDKVPARSAQSLHSWRTSSRERLQTSARALPSPNARERVFERMRDGLLAASLEASQIALKLAQTMAVKHPAAPRLYVVRPGAPVQTDSIAQVQTSALTVWISNEHERIATGLMKALTAMSLEACEQVLKLLEIMAVKHPAPPRLHLVRNVHTAIGGGKEGNLG